MLHTGPPHRTDHTIDQRKFTRQPDATPARTMFRHHPARAAGCRRDDPCHLAGCPAHHGLAPPREQPGAPAGATRDDRGTGGICPACRWRPRERRQGAVNLALTPRPGAGTRRACGSRPGLAPRQHARRARTRGNGRRECAIAGPDAWRAARQGPRRPGRSAGTPPAATGYRQPAASGTDARSRPRTRHRTADPSRRRPLASPRRPQPEGHHGSGRESWTRRTTPPGRTDQAGPQGSPAQSPNELHHGPKRRAAPSHPPILKRYGA